MGVAAVEVAVAVVAAGVVVGRRGETMAKKNNTGCIGLSETPVVFLSRPTIPFALQLHVNERCNLRCKHCYSESWSKEMEFESFNNIIVQFKELLRLAKAEGTVYLTGGEPLLWPHLLIAIKTLVRNKLVPRVFTNATMVTRAYAQALKKAGADQVISTRVLSI